MTSEAAMALGREAKALLDNETFQKVFAHLIQTTVEQWRNTASGSASLREHYFFEVHGLEAIQGQLNSWVEDGQYAAAQIEKAAKRDAERPR